MIGRNGTEHSPPRGRWSSDHLYQTNRHVSAVRVIHAARPEHQTSARNTNAARGGHGMNYSQSSDTVGRDVD